jgi:hypothetical protein
MKVAAAWLVVVFASPALAYNEAVHAAITHRAIAEEGALLQPPSQADLDAFRALFWKRASRVAEFARRYPTLDSFGAWEFKQFVMLDPEARVHGFDALAEAPMTRRALLAAASRWPDDDERNRHRYLRDEHTHAVMAAPDGSPLPYDPATLDFGSATGTTSQGHAHYALVDEPLSDDPDVLKKEPWRFAVPPTAHAWGAELVDIYTDLAWLARGSGLPSARWLEAAFAGAAFHHLEDMCNQIHTVQVGIYEFFQSAWLQSKMRDLKTLGGVFGRRYSLKQIGLRLIANHHLMSEDLFAKHLAMPDDAGPPMDAKAIVRASSREGPEVYRLAWRFSRKSLRDGISGHEYDGSKGDDPDAYVDPAKADAIAQFYELQKRGVRRAIGAVRGWHPAEKDPTAMLVAYHAQAAQRRASYRPGADDEPGIAWGIPAAAALVLVAVVWSFRRKEKQPG